ncbi:MAG: helix-turn-helix transcriptional regulator [Acutalibacteraceae bacterium]|nr:helix-turn-helix transcriptional regulator [Clostridia bacterium]MBQ2319526.1 helix-turn-helix transcriptional regulator [Clostridia bacterium]MBQ5598400.1 helix-turn-helix transcriptional regulator [Clostridia bacterium]MEE1127011.1 helix-turn-helix transcriptional regulator [Acutalibacteraceae bacterium]
MRTRKKPLGTANMIGMRVEQLRNINNMKQKDLLLQLNSKGIEMNASGLSKLEGQIRQVNDYELVALAEIFGISVTKLLGIEQNINNHN